MLRNRESSGWIGLGDEDGYFALGTLWMNQTISDDHMICVEGVRIKNDQDRLDKDELVSSP